MSRLYTYLWLTWSRMRVGVHSMLHGFIGHRLIEVSAWHTKKGKRTESHIICCECGAKNYFLVQTFTERRTDDYC